MWSRQQRPPSAPAFTSILVTVRVSLLSGSVQSSSTVIDHYAVTLMSRIPATGAGVILEGGIKHTSSTYQVPGIHDDGVQPTLRVALIVIN